MTFSQNCQKCVHTKNPHIALGGHLTSSKHVFFWFKNIVPMIDVWQKKGLAKTLIFLIDVC
jgi:hypothetical protein